MLAGMFRCPISCLVVLAASQQFGVEQTDVFSVDESGTLNVSWVFAQGPWQGPSTIGPTGVTTSGAYVATSQQIGANQTDVFLIDKTGQLDVFWVDGGGAWQGPGKIGPAGLASPGSFLAASQQIGLTQTDLFLLDKNGLFNIFYVVGSNPWNGPVVRADPVAAPGSGLGSNSNYILNDNCSSILGLSVSLYVTEDMVWKSASGTLDGFSIQLNAYSPKNKTCAVQQYVISLQGTELQSIINNYTSAPKQLFLSYVSLTSVPSTKIPAGYVLTITLQNDSNGNITGAKFVVVNAQGSTVANVTQTILSISGATSTDLAPIVAFELDIVGPADGESTVLSSGVGYIVYSSPSPLTVLNAQPSCTEAPSVITEETANSFYGPMSATPSTMFTQGVWFSTAPQMIKKESELMHALPRRPEA